MNNFSQCSSKHFNMIMKSLCILKSRVGILEFSDVFIISEELN